MGIRIAKVIADSGVASRRRAEEMIKYHPLKADEYMNDFSRISLLHTELVRHDRNQKAQDTVQKRQRISQKGHFLLRFIFKLRMLL